MHMYTRVYSQCNMKRDTNFDSRKFGVCGDSERCFRSYSTVTDIYIGRKNATNYDRTIGLIVDSDIRMALPRIYSTRDVFGTNKWTRNAILDHFARCIRYVRRDELRSSNGNAATTSRRCSVASNASIYKYTLIGRNG